MKISSSKFVDITIFKRVKKEENVFINLTEGNLDDVGGNYLTFYIIPIDSDYCITVFSGTRITYAAEITIDEIVALADIQNSRFIKQLKTGVSEHKANDLIAMTCAEKIICYNNGRCEQELRDNSGMVYYNFFITRHKGIGKERIKTQVCVLSKAFRNTPVKTLEKRLWEKEEKMTFIK